MKLLGRTDVTTIEEPDHLQFVVARENGWIDLVAPPLVVVLIVVYCWIFHHYVFALLGVLAYAVSMARSLSDPTTRLFISQSEVIVRGKLARAFSDELRIPANEIKSLYYSNGGEDDPSGLYAQRGWRSICIVPGINKAQTNAIVESGRKKFPRFVQVG